MKHCWEKNISASPLGSCAPIQLSSQEPQRGSHTAIFKTDKNQACPIVSFVVTNPGFARARPNELRPNSVLAALGPLCQGLCFSELLLAGSRRGIGPLGHFVLRLPGLLSCTYDLPSESQPGKIALSPKPGNWTLPRHLAPGRRKIS